MFFFFSSSFFLLSNVDSFSVSHFLSFLSLFSLSRYTMKEEEIVDAAEWALEHGMGTLMLQSGELLTEKRLDFVERVVRRVRAVTRRRKEKEDGDDGGFSSSSSSSSSLAVALSIGELDAASYRRMVDAGASRYLLRIGESLFFGGLKRK